MAFGNYDDSDSAGFSQDQEPSPPQMPQMPQQASPLAKALSQRKPKGKPSGALIGFMKRRKQKNAQ